MPNATASLNPRSERIRQLLREIQASRATPDKKDAATVADIAQEIDITSMALQDELFVDAVTPQSRRKRLNQIRRSVGMRDVLTLPPELESPGFIANLKKSLPGALLKLDPYLQTLESALGTTSVGLAQLWIRGEKPVAPPAGAGFSIVADIVSIGADPATWISGGVGGAVAKGVAKKVGTKLAGRVAARGVAGGTTFAGLTAVRDPLGQQVATGKVDLGQTAVEIAKAAALGAVAIGAGAIGGKVVGTGLEIGVFSQGGALLDPEGPRWATLDDAIHSTGVIIGLKTAGAAQRRLGTALFKRSRGEQLSPEEQQTLDQTPETVKQRIVLEGKAKAGETVTSEQTFTKETLKTREGAAEFARRHSDVAKALTDAPTASRKNFRPLKQLLPDVDLNAAERNQLRAHLHELAGKPVVPVEPSEPAAGKAKPVETLTAEPMPEPGAKLDKLQETVIENVQAKATADTPPEAVPVVPVEATVGAKRLGLNPAKKLYRWLRTGGQHEDAVKTRTEFDRTVGSYLRQMKFSIDEYNRGIRKTYGLLGRVPKEDLARINAVLKEGVSPDTLPESIRGAVVKFRSDVDSLTTAMIREGVVEGEMGAIFTGNLGTYMHRTYRIFRTDPKKIPKFIRKLSPEARNNAIALFRSELEESLGRRPTADEADAYLAAFLYTSAKRGSPIEAAGAARLGTKELGILKFRKDVPPELRAVWGEDTNPVTQYANTVISSARLLASVRQLRDLRERGLGKWLFEQPQGEFIAQINDGKGEALYPLTQGKPLFTTIEYERAMRQAYAPHSDNWFLKAYFWLNAAVKAGKTAGSVMGINRNFLSNPLIALANGDINPWHMLRAARTTGTDILPSVFTFLKLSNRAQQETVQKLIRLGVVNAASRSGELRAIFKDASRHSGPSGYIESRALRALTLIPRKFFDFFRAGDDFWHVNGFYSNLAALKRIYPELSLEALERKAADKVIRTYPTYSEAPHAVQAMRKAIVVGDFVTFPAEMVRTTINIPRLVAEELANPKERAIGIRRAIGFTAMAATITGVGVATRRLTNVSKKEEEALRELAPDWMANSQWAHLGKVEGKKHQWRTVDTQYNAPQSFMVSPIIAALRGEDTREATEGALREVLRPFFNETILYGVVRDITANQRISSNSTAAIYNPESSAVDQTADIAQFITSKLQPGTIRSMERIVKGIQGKPLKSGTIVDPKEEALAVLLGIRLWTHDVPLSLGFRSSSLMDRRSDARRIFYSAAYAREGRDEAEIQDAYEKAVDAEREIFGRMQKIVHASKVLGLTDNEVAEVLNDKRVAVPKADVDRIISGVFEEEGLLRSMVWSLSGKEFDERVPRILKALGVSVSEAEDFLIDEMRERGYSTVPVLRIARLRQRIP